MAKNRESSSFEEDEDEDEAGHEDVFALSDESLRRRALRALEDEDALTLADCLEAGAEAGPLLEPAARLSTQGLWSVVAALRAKGEPGCSEEAVRAAVDARGGQEGMRVGMLLRSNASDEKPLTARELGAAERAAEAIEEDRYRELKAWVEHFPAVATDRLRRGGSPLGLAVENESLGSLRVLLAGGADPNEAGPSNRSWIGRALQMGWAVGADELLKAGAIGKLSLAGEEEGLMRALKERGWEDWAARVEREKLDRQTAESSDGARPSRARL